MKVRRRSELVLGGLPRGGSSSDDVTARAVGCSRPMVIEVDGTVGVLAQRKGSHVISVLRQARR